MTLHLHIKRGLCVAAVLAVLPCCGVNAETLRSDFAEQVVIHRTAYGVPHIEAESEAAAAFGFAYCQAEDHPRTLMRAFLRGRGELAKHFGGKQNVESDFASKQFRAYARGMENYHKLDPSFRAIMEGFTAGVNFYIDRHRADLPEWIQPITVHDLAAAGQVGLMRFAFNRGRIIERFLRKQKTETAMLPPLAEQDSMGSNMWAFAPSRTKSGNAILMGNPHQPWSERATYYEAHLMVPGEYNFYGSTFIGGPILTTGFNEYLGWSHTVNYPDLEEIYELDLDPGHPNYALFDGGAIPLWSEEATVEVKDGDTVESINRTFWYCPIGPVIHRTNDKIFVLKSVGFELFRPGEQWYAMTKAKSFEEFRKILDIRSIAMFNIAYADRDGNIYYLWNGSVPAIPHANQFDTAVHVSRSAEIWTQLHPIADLPQLLNPKGGYVQNSNSPPYFTNLHEPLDRDSYPAHFPDNRLSLRTQYSLELIHNDKKFSLEDVVDLKFSMGMLLADRVKDDLIAAVKATNPDGEQAAAVEMLEKWDNSVSADSVGSVLFEAWWRAYSRGLMNPYEVSWTPEKPVTTPHGLADRTKAVEAFSKALEKTKEMYGRWDVAWGDVHRVRKGNVDVPVGGGSGGLGCFRVLSFTNADDGKRVVSGGDSWIFAVEFGQTPKAYTVVGISQSEVEDSPHYADQAELYASNKMKRAAFTKKQIRAQLIRSYRPGEE